MNVTILPETQITAHQNPEEAIRYYLKQLKSEDMLVIIGSHYFGPYLNKIFKNCFVHDHKNP